MAVTGAGGMLARDLASAASDLGHVVIAFDRAALDVTDGRAVQRALVSATPDVILHCAAYTRVDDAEDDENQANLVNGEATLHVARAARSCGALLVYPSTDYVFDGKSESPYPETAPTSPLNAYGRSKVLGERAAREAGRYLVVRTSWLYGAHGRNFVKTMLRLGRSGAALRVVDDQRGSPTWTRHLATTIMALIGAPASNGIYHATNSGATTWHEFAQAIFDVAGIDAHPEPIASSAYPQRATRPRYSVLSCARTVALAGPAPHWRDALTAAMPELA